MGARIRCVGRSRAALHRARGQGAPAKCARVGTRKYHDEQFHSALVSPLRVVHGRQERTHEDIGHTVMRYRALLVLLCFLATQTSASDDPLANLKKGQPGDVKKLIDRLAGCSHWSGEEPYDADRRREIALAMSDLKCDQLAKDEAAIRKRYAKQERVLKVLRQAKELSW